MSECNAQLTPNEAVIIDSDLQVETKPALNLLSQGSNVQKNQMIAQQILSNEQIQTLQTDNNLTQTFCKENTNENKKEKQINSLNPQNYGEISVSGDTKLPQTSQSQKRKVILSKKNKRTFDQTSKAKQDVGSIKSNQFKRHTRHQQFQIVDQPSNFRKYKERLQSLTLNSPKEEPSEPLQVKLNKLENASFSKQKTIQDILAQIQQAHKEKLKEIKQNQLRSIQLKSKIRKLNPDATLQHKQKLKKQAELKLKNNLQFLQVMRHKPDKQIPTCKEFKAYPQQTKIMTGSAKFVTLRKAQPIYVENYQLHSNRSDLNNNQYYSIERLKKDRSNKIVNERSFRILPSIDKKQAIRPKPYSIYNIYQKQNQLYTYPTDTKV